MPRPKRAEPPILATLEEAFAKFRKKVKPPFPYDAKTQVIRLPHTIEEELRHLILRLRSWRRPPLSASVRRKSTQLSKEQSVQGLRPLF